MPDLIPMTSDRRKNSSIQVLALYFTILVNVIALVWAAATISAQVGQIRETLKPLVADVAQLKTDDAILQYRIRNGITK